MNVSPLEHMAVPLNFRHMAHHVCNELHHERNLVLKSNLHRHPVVCDDRFQLTSFRVGFVATELVGMFQEYGLVTDFTFGILKNTGYG